MTKDIHARAVELITRRRVELLTRDDEQWLTTHLNECAECAAEETRVSGSLSALRAMNIDLPRNLASRTQLRVRLRAEELREHGPANRLIWAVAVVSWILGLATAPWVWRGFEWAGTELGLPKLVWAAGVALWWIIPALAATGIVLLERKGRTNATE
jgi:hypothetical protein